MEGEKRTIDISAGVVWRLVLIVLLVWFLFLIRDILFLLLFAVVIVSAALPIVDRLEQKRIPRVISALLLYFAFFLVLGTIIYFLTPVAIEEFKKLGENLPVYLQGVDMFFQDLTELAANYQFGENIKTLVENGSAKISDSLGNLFSNAFSLLGGIFKLIVMISLSFYMLVKKDGTRSLLQAVVPKKHQEYVIDLVLRIQHKLGRWLIGMFSLVVIIFVLDYLVLTILNVPFALILAVLGGALEIVPYIGPTIALIPAALVALTISPLTMLVVILCYILIQQLENHVIAPLVMKKAVGLNPVIIILALLIGGQLAGILGVLIAVPLATAINVFMKDIFNAKN